MGIVYPFLQYLYFMIQSHQISTLDYAHHTRFWAKVDKHGPDWNGSPCWVWTAGRVRGGYGKFTYLSRTVLAHCVSYTIHGNVIPDGYHVHHKCYNTACVNPAHLQAIPPRNNILDNDSSGLAKQNLEKTHCPHGHEYTPDNTGIYRHPIKGTVHRHCKACKQAKCRVYYWSRKWKRSNIP